MNVTQRVLAAVVLLLLSRYALASDIDKAIEELLAEPRQQVAAWERYAGLALAIVVAIGVIGIFTTLIQVLPIPQGWAKVLTGIFGAAVGTLTVFGNASLDFDRRQYEQLARMGRHALNNIKSAHAIHKPNLDNQEARDGLMTVVRENVNRILELEERMAAERRGLFGDKKKDVGSFLFRDAVAAEEGLPGWASKVPSDDTNIYFVGLGEGRDYVSARQASRDRAYEDARQFLAGRFGSAAGVDAQKLSAYLLESARVLQTHYVLDKGRGIYRFYSLLGVSRKLAGSDLRMYAAKNEVKNVGELDAALRGANRSETDYISARFRVYQGQSAKAQETLSRRQYDDYLKARDLRFSKQRPEAIGILRDLVKSSPEFYLGWFNLALVLDEDGRHEEARQAYERALAIARRDNIQDASIYNSYGYLLYRMKRAPEAVPLLEQALKLAPDHPTAKTTLAAAKSAR